MEDRIPGWLQYRHETCCEKSGCCGRRACMVWRWFSLRECYFQTGGLVYDTDEAPKELNAKAYAMTLKEEEVLNQ